MIVRPSRLERHEEMRGSDARLQSTLSAHKSLLRVTFPPAAGHRRGWRGSEYLPYLGPPPRLDMESMPVTVAGFGAVESARTLLRP
ncbi:hypothetical protein CCHR01_09772 [Colletotrichum chrysophilum]|uniref:Uncharacterized protein n=1 Tax=Colletotrichum chrysophilum TaxID=1836956 RepID=A0AAD9EGF8_9PEZI|nr:hypothetical protein CCHR01_09772 [Colletotrichum chrysophilum]